MDKIQRDMRKTLMEKALSAKFPQLYSKKAYADILFEKRKAIVVLKDEYDLTFRTLANMLGDNISVAMCRSFYSESKNIIAKKQ